MSEGENLLTELTQDQVMAGIYLRKKLSVRVFAGLFVAGVLYVIARYFPYGAVLSGEFLEFSGRAILLIILMVPIFFTFVYYLFLAVLLPHRIISEQGIWRTGALGKWCVTPKTRISKIERSTDGVTVYVDGKLKWRFLNKNFLPPEIMRIPEQNT